MIKVGEIIADKYRVTRVLGEGGMGIVVQAHHEILDMLVAIKFMRSEMVAAGGGAERFLREARALVKLKSQHAVKVHDLGVHGRMPYIVMEHLEGSDLQTILDKHGPLSPADAARHIRQACEAISEAHSLGIYHRDLKPANLFLARGASERIIVKVLDFGIAKMMRANDDKSSLQTSLTGTNVLMGTIPYMSPEQLLSPKSIDARADIWSLGVVLYELVTGELPFQGRDLYEVQQAIRHEDCLMPEMPVSLRSVIRRCLEKNRDDRYASVVDLAQALRPIMHESLSPFGVPSRGSRYPQADRPSNPPPTCEAPTVPNVQLAATEGLPGPKESEPATIRIEHKPQNAHQAQNATLPSTPPPPLPPADEMVTLRVRGKVAVDGQTNRIPKARESRPARQSAPERLEAQAPPPRPSRPADAPPKKNPLGNLQARVVPVRRGVLVVNQPIQLSRRRRTPSRLNRVVLGAVLVCVLVIGFNAWRECAAETAMAAPGGFTATNK
jgi:eukaryotic-like serine/threonine-protein kinase